MITRDLANIQVVHAINPRTTAGAVMPWSDCGDIAGMACSGDLTMSTAALSGQGMGGPMIDRLGLRQNYNSVAPIVDAWGVIANCDTGTVPRYLAVSVGLQHSSSTCSADFANLSTDLWLGPQPLQIITTTTTSCSPYYDCTGEAQAIGTVQAGALTTGNTTACGFAQFSGPAPVFSLASAKRFLRMVVAPINLASGSDTAVPLYVSGVLVFGDADAGKVSTSLRSRIAYSTACST